MNKNGFKKNEIWIIILGVVLTAFAFCAYFLLKITWLNILFGIVCLCHLIYLMYFLLGDKNEFTKRERILYPTVLLTVFYGLLIALISIFNPLGRFCFDYVLWVLYCGSSAVPLLYVFLMIISFSP